MHELVNGWYKGRAAIKKPFKGAFFDNINKPKAACYTGAIYYGLHNKASDIPIIHLVAEGYKELRSWVEPPCDCDSENVGTISGVLIHLNDVHDRKASDWPEQKITDWLVIALNNNYETRELLEKSLL